MMENDNPRALVTGSSGFIGRRLLERMRNGGTDAAGWTRADGDLRDPDAVRTRLARIRPDHIFHLASNPPNPAAETWTRVADEQAMLANLAYAMPSHCRLIYAGSMAEYGRAGLLREIDQCVPDTGYGCAKFSGTNLAVALRTILQVDIRVGRLFGVYGPGEGSSRLLPALLAKLRSSEPMLLSDGEQLRDFIHVDDVCTVLVALAEAPCPPPLINVGTGRGVSVRHVCETVASVLNANPGLLRFGARPRRNVDQDALVAGTELLRSVVEPPPQRWLDKALAAKVVDSMCRNLPPA